MPLSDACARPSRYITFNAPSAPGLRPIRVTLDQLDGFGAFSGEHRWVGPPQSYPEENPAHPDRTMTASALRCEPQFQDWSSVGLLHVFGGEVVATSQYAVEVVDSSCPDLSDPTCYITLATVHTGNCGDVVDPLAGPGSDPQPDFKDISAVVQKFVEAMTAPLKVQAQLQPNVVFPDRPVDFKDITTAVAAFVGVDYAAMPFAHGPCTCPSSVTCGVACTGDDQCGDGFCIEGLCTDACARCTP